MAKNLGNTSEKELFNELAKAVVDGDENATRQLAEKVVAAGINPIKAIIEGFSKGMTVVGEKFHNFEIFLPDMMMAADAMKAGVEVLRPHISEEEIVKSRKGVVVIGTVSGDIHDIGKNLVVAMIEAAGFEVHDIGVDAEPKKFIEISYITIKRMDNPPFASMLFFADLRIVAHLMENINHV